MILRNPKSVNSHTTSAGFHFAQSTNYCRLLFDVATFNFSFARLSVYSFTLKNLTFHSGTSIKKGQASPSSSVDPGISVFCQQVSPLRRYHDCFPLEGLEVLEEVC